MGDSPNTRRAALVLALLALPVVAGCGKSKDKKTAAGPSCAKVAAPKPREVGKRNPPRLELKPTKTYKATVTTSCGTFVITLDSKRAPKTGGSFVTLAKSGFYDGLQFHRIAPGFVIQGGDPAGDGTGGPGYKVREAPPRDLVYAAGSVAMAKAANEPPGTSGSQFFVTTSDSSLDPEYALLGKVTEGFDVIKEIESHGAPQQDGPPDQAIVIKKITVED